MEAEDVWLGYREFISKGFVLRVYSRDVDGIWPPDQIMDVDVILNPTSKFTGMVCTIHGILRLMQKDEFTGESNGGEHFFIPNLLILKEMNLKLLLRTIESITLDGELDLLFKYVDLSG